MENDTKTRNILTSLFTLLKFTIFFFLVYLYFEKWIKSAKEGNWLLFIMMSIFPIMMLYCIIEAIYNNSNNVYSDMMDAQINAWKKQ